jgi:hypothetical protein
MNQDIASDKLETLWRDQQIQHCHLHPTRSKKMYAAACRHPHAQPKKQHTIAVAGTTIAHDSADTTRKRLTVGAPKSTTAGAPAPAGANGPVVKAYCRRTILFAGGNSIYHRRTSLVRRRYVFQDSKKADLDLDLDLDLGRSSSRSSVKF